MRRWIVVFSLLTILAETPPSFGDIVVRHLNSTGSINSLADSDALISGTGIASESTSLFETVNFVQVGGIGNFGADSVFPNAQSSNDENFVIHATGRFYIPTDATWTFGTNSDDGVRLRINNADVIVDDSLHAPQDRFGTLLLTTGWHDFDLVFFEHTGGAALEFFAAQGTHSSFAGNNFQLVGDTANGGLSTVPEPGSWAAIAILGIAFSKHRRRSK